MPERTCMSGDVEICFETFGDDSDPTLLLIMGLATQMVAWRDDFCAELAGRGFHVVRFDNRDIGRSGRIDAEPPTVGQLIRRSRRAAAYTLSDMAADGLVVLDALGVEDAHVVGASMGGMIAQTLAIEHPARVRSLVSIMSATGGRLVGQPSPRLYPLMLRSAPSDRDAYVDHVLRMFRVIGSPRLDDQDLDDIRSIAALSHDRGVDPAGPGRQLAAVIASGDRTRRLRSIDCPTLVIHGDRDKLVPLSGGKATARAIPGARLMVIKGMGHDMPRWAWPQVIDGIADNAALAKPAAPASAEAAA